MKLMSNYCCGTTWTLTKTSEHPSNTFNIFVNNISPCSAIHDLKGVYKKKKYQSWGLNWVIIGASILNKTEYLSRCANWFPEFENLKLSSASLKFKKILGGTYALHGYYTWRHLFLDVKRTSHKLEMLHLLPFIFYSPFVTSGFSGIFNMWLFFFWISN